MIKFEANTIQDLIDSLEIIKESIGEESIVNVNRVNKFHIEVNEERHSINITTSIPKKKFYPDNRKRSMAHPNRNYTYRKSEKKEGSDSNGS